MTLASTTSIILSFLMALLAMAFYTLMERKFLGYFQLRKGPNKVGLLGIPQPFADAMKLFVKERSTPNMSNQVPFMMAPVLSLMLALMMWVMYPHANPALFIMFGALYFLCVSSMNVYSTFLAGWSSNSKYALLGALRGVAQTISYEVSMSLILLSVLCIQMTMDFTIMNLSSMTWAAFLLPPMFITWFTTNLAETSRTPFDLTEGESELVSGFNVEYSNGSFALIFMAEYTNILLMSLITSTLFIGMIPILSNAMLLMKTIALATLFIWVRATLPRMRYDLLMNLTWKTFLPVALATLIIMPPIVSILY